jgi:NACHT domain
MINDYLDPVRSTATKAITTDVKEWFKKLDPKGSKLKGYHKGIQKGYGVVQIMGMASPRKLEHVYAGLRASANLKKFYRPRPDIDTASLNRIVTAKNMWSWRENNTIEEFLREVGYGPDIERLEANEFRNPRTALTLNSEDLVDTDGETPRVSMRSDDAVRFVDRCSKLFILGQPGSGKTTFMKYLVLIYSKNLRADINLSSLLPLFVPLRELKKTRIAVAPISDWLRNLVLSSAAEVSNTVFTKELLEEMLQRGVCLVLLDGIEEVPVADLAALYHSIRAFSLKYQNNKIVVTCRVASFDRGLEGFEVCETSKEPPFSARD